MPCILNGYASGNVNTECWSKSRDFANLLELLNNSIVARIFEAPVFDVSILIFWPKTWSQQCFESLDRRNMTTVITLRYFVVILLRLPAM